LISYEKKNPTTIFIQLLRTKTIKKTNIVKKNLKKEKKYYLNVGASEAKKREKKTNS
jgi:hypothetical protein